MKKNEVEGEPTETTHRLRRDSHENRQKESTWRRREAELREHLDAGMAREAANEEFAKALRAEERRSALGRDFRDP